jgi:glyoxylase-like metal-dependent hydrolase (beta-lactamase superfamily II)
MNRLGWGLIALEAECLGRSQQEPRGWDTALMIHRFSVGSLDCIVISDGQPAPPWQPPLWMFFTPNSGVPKQELAGAVAGEGEGRTTLTCGYNCLSIPTPAGLALIDAGLGGSFTGYVGGQVGKIVDGMVEAGLSMSDFVAVLFTHLHQDHVRGAIWSGDLTFPAATAHAHVAELAFWPNPAASLAVGPDAEPAREAIRLFGERLRAFEYDAGILPQIRTVNASGHTPGHTAFLLSSGGERLLSVGDTFYDRLQLSHPGWWTPFDLDPERSVLSRRNLLAWAADENLLVHAYHMPFPGLGWVKRHADAFDWSPAVPLPAG